MAFPPRVFASQSGNVPASELDDNFAACQPALTNALSIVGNNTGAPANAQNLTAAQVYALIKGSIPWEVASFLGGTQTGASWQVMRYASTLANNITGAIGSAAIAATASTVFTIADNGTPIGTATFAASGMVATVAWTVSLPYTLIAGNALTITGPVSPDATLANINFTIGGNRA